MRVSFLDAIVFGIGNYYKTKLQSVQTKYDVIAYLDSSVKPDEQRIFDDGKTILNPERWNELPDVPILLMSAKFMEMYERITELGVDGKRVIFGSEFKPAYDPFEEMLEEYRGNIVVDYDTLCLKFENMDYSFRTAKELEGVIRSIYRKNKPEIDMIRSLPMKPISRRYGREHGTPIDRYYIEKTLYENRDKICGDVAEFADDTYTKRFGTNLNNNYVLHLNGWGENVIKANLVTGEGIEDNMVDCLICTQVIQFIYEIDKAIHNISRMLKNGGVAIITAHGIAQLSLYDYRNWGEYWRFSEMSLKNLFCRNTSNCEIEVKSYGNVKTAAAMLYGLCAEDLTQDDFIPDDEQYPLLLCVLVRKGDG